MAKSEYVVAYGNAALLEEEDTPKAYFDTLGEARRYVKRVLFPGVFYRIYRIACVQQGVAGG